jgi:hypothetical protein
MEASLLTVLTTTTGGLTEDITVTVSLYPNNTATIQWGRYSTSVWTAEDFEALLDAMDIALWEIELDATAHAEWSETLPAGVAADTEVVVPMGRSFRDFLEWARPQVTYNNYWEGTPPVVGGLWENEPG